MHSNAAFDTSGAVTVESGEVMIDGPNGIALSLTPRAAREMGRRLIAAADRAAGQGTMPDGAQEDCG
ncbi:hypothetical protein [Sphingomonas colocasiae]|uniref:Uncharacterized protein n=1 Tax=Sphingomonas colocasiae TaxID=1848973 RepID=A0ABS7Q0V1_9SPHN|nr:hypothetical protein [Sphingomonas colocasiae]MBY8826157.1 hypothetical protein [Sphingomonas colocasiae]